MSTRNSKKNKTKTQKLNTCQNAECNNFTNISDNSHESFPKCSNRKNNTDTHKKTKIKKQNTTHISKTCEKSIALFLINACGAPWRIRIGQKSHFQNGKTHIPMDITFRFPPSPNLGSHHPQTRSPSSNLSRPFPLSTTTPARWLQVSFDRLTSRFFSPQSDSPNNQLPALCALHLTTGS